MTIRLAVDGRGRLRHAVLQELVRQSEGRIEVALHFGDRDATFHGPSLQRMEVRRGTNGHLMQRHLAHGANIPLLASTDFHKMVEQGIDQLHRDGPTYRYRGHNLVNLQDYLDYYHILADAMAQQIEGSGATHALFMNMPHLSYDVVFYHVARALGLKTLVMCQTIFPDQYFTMPRMEDMGAFTPLGDPAAPLPIEPGSRQNLIYMDERWQKPSARGRIGPRAVWNLLRHLALRDPARLLQPGYLFGNLRRIAAIYGQMPDWKDPFARFFHVNEMAYFEHMAEYELPRADLSTPYIYVPLHNQPEMSTSALGGDFRDQLLMVEALAADLPEGWRILVKENPRQGGFARGPMWFHRLTRLRGVALVPSDTSSADLLAGAQFTATVSGTAGYESLRGGRVALYFGRPWWRSFPGAIPWKPGLDFHALAATRLDHAALEAAAGQVVARAHDGVIETIYSEATPGFDAAANACNVAGDLMALLEGTAPPTFGDPRALGWAP